MAAGLVSVYRGISVPLMEGMKQLLNFTYSSVFLEEMLPNDDLDLQVLWLEVLEKYGADFTSEQLAEAFSTKCPYAPGEYAYFKKNFYKGIRPPLSGVSLIISIILKAWDVPSVRKFGLA